jgi:hypothetical protein
MGLFERASDLIRSRDEARPAVKPGRNDPCWCGSGKKYKKCHLPEDDKKQAKACSLNCGTT